MSNAKELLEQAKAAGGQARTTKVEGSGFLKFRQAGQYAEFVLGDTFVTPHGAAINVTILQGDAVIKPKDSGEVTIKPGVACALGLNKAQLNDQTFTQGDKGRVALVVYNGKVKSKQGREVDTYDIIVRDMSDADRAVLKGIPAAIADEEDDDLPF